MRFHRPKGSFSPTSFSLTVHNRSLKLTKEGGFFIILILGIGFAAINTGINLLYLILAMCLSFIIVSGVLSELTLRDISITRILPFEIFAGETFPVQVEVKNKKKRFPTYSIWVEEYIESSPDSNPPLKSHNVAPGLSKEEKGFNLPRFYFYHIKARGSEKKTQPWVFMDRGLFKTKGVKISTSYPFGFFIKTALIDQMEERVVYPKIKNLSGFSEQLASGGEVTTIKKGRGDDIFGFRRFTYGDSVKMVHWKTSAKANDLMIKEYFEDENKKIIILFDNHIRPEKYKINSNKAWYEFNEGVTQAASLTNHFILQGYQVKMVTHCKNIPFGSGSGHLATILYHLALLGPSEEKTDLNNIVHEQKSGIIHLSFAGKYRT